MFYNGPRAFRCIFMSNWMCSNHSIFVVLQSPALILWHFHVQSYERNSLDFLRFTMARGRFAAFSWPAGIARACAWGQRARARGTVCTRCTRASSHVQWTISMRVRGRAVIFMAFNAFAEMLNKCVFIAHSGVCHELNSLIWACGM